MQRVGRTLLPHRSKFLQYPMSNWYDGYMVNNKNNNTPKSVVRVCQQSRVEVSNVGRGIHVEYRSGHHVVTSMPAY